MPTPPSTRSAGLLLLLAVGGAFPTTAQETVQEAPAGVDLDTVRAGRFDYGKMWTFEYPPVDYLRETYDFAPDSSWFSRARLGALRIPSCSASFVSPRGLVMTNHHCARDAVSQVAAEGETLLDDGFYASSLEDERRIEEFWADQLVDIVDVTDEVDAALEGVEGDEARAQAREEAATAIEERLTEERGGEEAGVLVEVISLWNGGRYSAYVFRHYEDVRLVMAPELAIGFFGGDPDNFTYPRYNLDMSFLRVYDASGEPLETEHWFPLSPEHGVESGDLVFVVGNPGSTSRLQTVAQLEWRRDVEDRALLAFLESRADVYEEFIEAHPELAETRDLRNVLFGLLNSEKAYRGQLEGLEDPVILARRRAGEEAFLDSIGSTPALQEEYGDLVARMGDLQERKREMADVFRAFLAIGNPEYESATLRRAIFAYQYLLLRQRGAPEETLTGVVDEIRATPDQPDDLDEALMAERFRDFQRYLGDDSPVVEEVLQGRSAEGAAAAFVQSSALSDSASAIDAVREGLVSPGDPAVAAVASFIRPFFDFQGTFSGLGPEEEEIASRLGRARFEIFGTDVPPDATFSLRIADGVVRGYEYNGTLAPYHTTFFGLYDRHHAFSHLDAWELPERWLDPPESFDLATSLNFVSTADIIGGNSGSPVLDRELRVVGLVFDGNIESLTGDYIYLDERARSVAVDARGIVEALRDVYGAERLVEELLGAGATAPGGR